MDRLVDIARSMVPDKFTVARIRACGDDPSKYLLQVSGRDVDFLARADSRFSVGDDVMVLLEPNVHAPVILDLSPWRACSFVVPSTNNGQPWTAADIDPASLAGAIGGRSDVSANLAAAHARAHSMTSTPDHVDVSGAASDEALMVYSGSSWQPVALRVRLDGGTR